MLQFALIILGGLIGSALNVLADDLPHRTRPHSPHCHACGFPYHRSQWAALAALVAGRWRCAQCNAPLLWRRVVVEVASAAMLAYVFQRFGLTLKFGLLAALLECLLLITVIDLEHRLILYITVFPTAVVALLYGLFGGELDFNPALTKTLIGGGVGFGVFYLFYLLGIGFGVIMARVRGEPLSEIAFGGGDANLGGVVGLAVGWPGIVLTVLYAVVSGGIAAGLYLTIMRLRKRYNSFTPIPYGPFIVFGAVVILLFAADIKRFYGTGP